MRSVWFSSAIVSIAALGVVHAEPFHIIQTPNSAVTGMSHDANYAVSVHADPFAGTQVVLWTRADESEAVLPGLNNANAVNTSRTIVGTFHDSDTDEDVPALLSLEDSEPHPIPIPLLPDTEAGDARDISDEGTVVGLNASADGSVVKAFVWTAAQGTQKLSAASDRAYATRVSADGRVIVGATVIGEVPQGTVWIDGQPITVTDAQGNPVGEAEAVSSNGAFVVGQGLINAQGQTIAWRWNVQTHQLQPIPNMWFAGGVSDDGRTVIGDTGFAANRVLAVWSQGRGTVTLRDYITARNVEIPKSWAILVGAMVGISPDGKTFAGCCGLQPDLTLHGFIVDALEPQLDHIFGDGFETPVQPVHDPGFESTTAFHGSNPSWEGSDSNPSADGGTPFTSVRNGDPTNTGFWSVIFGGWFNGSVESQKISQQVQLPSSGPAFVNLHRFIAQVPDVDAELSVTIDKHFVYSRDLSSLEQPDAAFVTQSIDISVYADGGTHTLEISYDYNGSDNDGFIFIDDVTIDPVAKGDP